MVDSVIVLLLHMVDIGTGRGDFSRKRDRVSL